MTRPLRVHAPRLTYHVMARGNARMRIFLDDAEHERFLWLLDDIVGRYELRCVAYCLMPNHYHLVLQTAVDNLSRAIRQLNGVYAQWWNRRHGRVGHVTQGRFKAQVVQEERYLLAVCRYVLQNPVRAGLVADPLTWRWSSCAATLGVVEAPGWLSPELLLDMCSAGPATRQRAALRRLLRRDDDAEVAVAVRDDWRVIGDDGFARDVLDGAASTEPAIAAGDRRPPLAALRRELLEPTGGPLAVRVARLIDEGTDVALVRQALGLRLDDVRLLVRQGRRLSQKLHAAEGLT